MCGTVSTGYSALTSTLRDMSRDCITQSQTRKMDTPTLSKYPTIHTMKQMCLHTLQWCLNEHDGVSDHRLLDCLTVCSGADQRKHKSSASLAFVRGIQLWPVVPLTKGQLRRICSIWWRHHVKWKHPRSQNIQQSRPSINLIVVGKVTSILKRHYSFIWPLCAF